MTFHYTIQRYSKHCTFTLHDIAYIHALYAYTQQYIYMYIFGRVTLGWCGEGGEGNQPLQNRRPLGHDWATSKNAQILKGRSQ